jgi:hypothetical protein
MSSGLTSHSKTAPFGRSDAPQAARRLIQRWAS